MLTKTAEYALRSVVFMGGHKGVPVSADQLSQKTKTPRRYLQRVLQDLVAADLVGSRPGPGGGYLLVVDAEKITVLDVINAVGSIERIKACPLGLNSHKKLCPLHSELDKAYAATEAAFRAVTIGQLLKSTNPIIPLCEVPS